ncbi:LysR family transcriptional regulator [Rhodococcus sp. KBS0724]|jgi:DNA-binding transcriptional LysR family regulator|uniref:LysR family transcriptional regulator n=1 Tax=Rhodococcus sp. KBS0724 TaxID=1179674 RepID=UPI00110E712F|nr:LysR family transcriptional regulator [Rhodococcus sp. KBS0724]TSD47474.1 LysR family transcriptional regulator [Rhodococcus sp. KBS0724]
MDSRKLTHFAAVAELGNFTRAAEILHLSQSGLSASIRALENDLGCTLFERTTRSVLLTASGHLLHRHAPRILREIADAQNSLDALKDCDTGSFALGVVQTLSAVDLPAVLAQFHLHHPGINVTLIEAPSADLLAAVESADLDLAYVALDSTALPPGLVALRNYTERLLLVVGEAHALAERSTIELAELQDHSFIDFQAGLGLETVVAALFAESGVHRHIAFRTSEMDLVLALVRHSLGVAVVPEPIAERSGLRQILLTPGNPAREVALIGRTPSPTNPAARAFLRLTADPDLNMRTPRQSRRKL